MNEDAPDTGLQNKALGWLNNSYQEVYSLASSFSGALDSVTSTVAVTAGAANLPVIPRRITLVVDTPSKRILKLSDAGSLAQKDPSLTRAGNPAYFYFNGAGSIKTFPINDTSLSVTYIPNAAELVIGDPESAIKIPPRHHETLVWAALIEGMTYERGFGNDSLLQLANSRKKELLDNYMRDLRENYSAPQRTQIQDF